MELEELIRAELKKQGLPESFVTFIKAEKADDVEGAVKTFADAYKVELQKEGDRRATEATKTAVKNFREKHNLDESGKPIQTDPEPSKPSGTKTGEDEIPEGAQKIIDNLSKQIESLTQSVQGIVKNQIVTQKQSEAKRLMGETKIPEKLREKWLKRIDVESETSVEDQVKELETEYLDIHQAWVDSEVESGDYTLKTRHKELSEDEYREIMDGNGGEDEAGTVKLNVAD